MLNLVQLQDRLKDVPMQALMQYANGASPQVPPFIALGELNRRKKMQEAAAAEQAKEMEGAPTIKEQIEQQTGLMALQGARMQQAADQQANQVASAITPAPNTMETQPAQLAGGGLAQIPNGLPKAANISPDMLKKLMALMMLKSKGGLDKLPMKKDMFTRDDYAKGGIVAFAGDEPEGSFVKTDDNFYQLDSELPKDEEEKDLAKKIIMDIIKSRKERPSYAQQREAAGLPSIAPDTTAKTREDLARREKEAVESDTLVNRILALKPGRFASGETAASVVAYDQQQAAKINDIKKLQAAAEDQRTAAEAAFKEGRFKDEQTYLNNADRFDLEAASKLATTEKDIAQRNQAKQTNLTYLTEAIDRAQADPTPENIRKMKSAIAAAQYVTPLTSEALGIKERLGQGGIEVNKDTAFTNARDKIVGEYKMALTIASSRGDTKEVERLKKERDSEIADARARIYGGQPASTPAPTPTPEPKAGGATRTKPNISGIKGAPSGSTVGSYVDGKGWEIRGQDGKLLGYAKG
jgi:hypothetical protein